MAAPRALLQGEVVAYDARPHLLYFLLPVLWGVPVSGVAIGWFATDGWLADVLRVVLLPTLAAWSALFAWRLLQWRFTRFTVSNHRVMFRAGVIGRAGVEIPMERVSNVNFHQSVLERIIGAGDLVIESSGVDGQSRFTDIRHPDAVQLQIHEAIVAARRPSPPPPVVSLTDEMERLGRLHREGLLTDAEFETAKRHLLG
jgi:uncharacterized membrane protein YdbT with pleckstrin-like domain